MHLSIIVPVFNEEKTVFEVLQRLSLLDIPGVTISVITVDDGSEDNTLKELEKAKKKFANITILRHPKNSGKGAAIQTGIREAKGDYLLIQDADLEYNPSDIKKLLKPVIEERAKVVYGTRLKRMPNFSRDERTPTFFLHYLGNRVLSFVTSILYGQWVTDMETGYKLLPREFLNSIALNARSFDFEPEITAKVLKRGYRIYEVPITTNPRNHSDGKKLVALKDGPVALWTLIKYRVVD